MIYKCIIPFVVIQLLSLVVLASFPELTTWLPRLIFGTCVACRGVGHQGCPTLSVLRPPCGRMAFR